MNTRTARPVDIYHDGVSRTTLVRLVGTAGCCRWCGATKPRTFDYWWESDDEAPTRKLTREPGQETGPYCSLGCYRSEEGMRKLHREPQAAQQPDRGPNPCVCGRQDQCTYWDSPCPYRF